MDNIDLYENVSLQNFVAPRILSFQPNKNGPVKLFPFDPKNIIYSARKKCTIGHVVNLEYHLVDEDEKLDCNVPIVLQTPVMKTPFGFSESAFKKVDAKTGQSKPQYNLHMTMGDIQNNDSVRDFFMAMYAWDCRTLEVAQSCKAQWFPATRNLKDNQVEVYQKRLSDVQTNKTNGAVYPPRLNLKIDERNSRIDTKFFDSNRNPVDPTECVPGSCAQAIIECSGIWFSEAGFSTSLKAKQVQLSPMASYEKYSFADTSAVVEEEQENNDSCMMITE